MLKLLNLLFTVCFATGYIHSGEIKIFNVARNEMWQLLHNSVIRSSCRKVIEHAEQINDNKPLITRLQRVQ